MDHLQLAGPVGGRRIGDRHHAAAAVLSAATHVAFALLVFMLVRASPPGAGAPGAALRDASAQSVVFGDPRAGGGGGGSGNEHPEMSRIIEMAGHDRTTVPVARSASFEA